MGPLARVVLAVLSVGNCLARYDDLRYTELGM
jgi:hypothetical protein